MKSDPLPRLDEDEAARAKLLPHCRLKLGDCWKDPIHGHLVACLDASDGASVRRLMNGKSASLAIQDPPYNVAALKRLPLPEYIAWCRKWVQVTFDAMAVDSSLYFWLGADQNDGFQPLPDFMILMREFPLSARSFLTMRNQRGYGTQHNWMAVRQELLYYTKGKPGFNVDAEYTDIPKILRGYYKRVGGKLTENLERGHADTIRAGNVWVDIQQVFYRMEENVSGCYAQKPLKSIDRIMRASSTSGDLVIDLFSHSGTTLLAAELSGRRCVTADIDPVYAEITIRRLENYRKTGRLGWQNGNPFEGDVERFARPRTAQKNERPSAQKSLFDGREGLRGSTPR